MSRDRHLIIFLKAPRLGAAKSRLARDIGRLPALDFYRLSSTRLVRRLSADRRWKTWLYVAPAGAARSGRFWPENLVRRAQSGGDLGRRMASALEDFTGPAVLIGSDLPDIGRNDITNAFAALGRSDMVFGPAADGGYWLVGARGRRPLQAIFRNVRWSTDRTLADTQANIGSHLRVALLDRREDVDDAASFARWQTRTRT